MSATLRMTILTQRRCGLCTCHTDNVCNCCARARTWPPAPIPLTSARIPLIRRHASNMPAQPLCTITDNALSGLQLKATTQTTETHRLNHHAPSNPARDLKPASLGVCRGKNASQSDTNKNLQSCQRNYVSATGVLSCSGTHTSRLRTRRVQFFNEALTDVCANRIRCTLLTRKHDYTSTANKHSNKNLFDFTRAHIR